MAETFKKSAFLKNEALLKLGEEHVGFSKSTWRTKIRDKRIQNWVYIAAPRPAELYSINPELKDLMEDMCGSNPNLKTGNVECTFDQWLQVIQECQKRKLKLTVKKEVDEDALLMALAQQVEEDIEN